jgi:hypothetical protein
MRRNVKADKKLADDARLLRWWKQFHRDEKAAVLAGPYATTLAELFRMFVNIKHVEPSQLVGMMRAIDWSEIDYPTRLTVISEINAAITKLREQHGLAPIDDPLPGAPDNAFRIIRAIINSSSPASTGKADALGPNPGNHTEQRKVSHE